MAKTLQQSRNELRGKHYKLSSYLKQAAQIKANSISTETPAHLACNIARDTVFTKSMKKDLLILQVPIDLKNILPNKNTNIEKEVLQDIIKFNPNQLIFAAGINETINIHSENPKKIIQCV